MSQNLLLNTQKTKIMVVDKGRERKEDFVLDGEKIEEVESFVYLGSLINTKAVVHKKSGGGWRWVREQCRTQCRHGRAEV